MVGTLLLTLALLQQPPAAEPKPAAAPGEPAAIAVVKFDDSQARQALADFKKLPPKASLVDRVAAVEALARGTHETLIPIFDKLVRSDPSLAVRKKAAEALGWQPEKKAYVVVTKLLDDAAVTKTAELIEPLIRALAGLGYTAKDWKRLETFFRAGYGQDRIGLQRAIIALADKHKEKQAIAVLLDNLDEPLPKDEHGADNPPAEYWEARWKAWQVWRDELRAALQTITGQKFASEEEARAWLKVNASKLGVKG
jgi:HEAT repeat protein